MGLTSAASEAHSQGGNGTYDCHLSWLCALAYNWYSTGYGVVSEQLTLFVTRNQPNTLLPVEQQLQILVLYNHIKTIETLQRKLPLYYIHLLVGVYILVNPQHTVGPFIYYIFQGSLSNSHDLTKVIIMLNSHLTCGKYA